MNILLINHYAGSPWHGMEFRPYFLAREWTRLGHRVTIAAATHSHLRSGPERAKGLRTEEVIDGIAYWWFGSTPYERNGVKRGVNILSFVANLLVNQSRFVREVKPDVVIASSTYPLDIYPAYRIARACGAVLVHEVHDLWPLTPVTLGQMSARHPFIRLLQRAEDFACTNADRIISMLPHADRYLIGRGLDPAKYSVIPNGVDLDAWREPLPPLPGEHQAMLDRIRQEGRLLVIYAGHHGLANALGQLTEAARLLEGKPITFVLVGQGPSKAEMESAARAAGATNLVFLPPVAKASIPALLNEADILYLGWNRSPLYQYGVSPNKLFEYMMAAKPVVHAIDAGNDPVAEARCGRSVPPDEPRALADAFLELAALPPDARCELGQHGREFVVAHHNYRVLAERFLSAVAGPSICEHAATAVR
jgi:glycosyltransferase involved in cell wall biosynthesis